MTRELAIADAKAGLALLQERGGEFGLSTRKIGVIGFSAGGHLAARLKHATAGDTPPDFVVLMYPGCLDQGGKVLDDVARVMKGRADRVRPMPWGGRRAAIGGFRPSKTLSGKRLPEVPETLTVHCCGGVGPLDRNSAAG